MCDPVIGRLVERGLHDELRGSAYAVVAGVDGRSHHLRFADIDMTGDAKPGAIVELRLWDDVEGRQRQALATRSDLPLEAQVDAAGATWLDRQALARQPLQTGGGFGAEVREALERRVDHLVDQGLARRRAGETVFEPDLLGVLRRRDLAAAAAKLAQATGLVHRPAVANDHVAGVYRRRLDLASGRFAMIEDGLGFQLAPWRPALEPHLGRHVMGIVTTSGVEWSLGRRQGLGR